MVIFSSHGRFSALQRAENSSIRHRDRAAARQRSVSVLFSEPKIPQSTPACGNCRLLRRFSALQRAENSSMRELGAVRFNDEGFSALQRAENSSMLRALETAIKEGCFSALQRAENSSMLKRGTASGSCAKFQCSSASRKFLNPAPGAGGDGAGRRFSALQRAENSSIPSRGTPIRRMNRVSVLFSEPKIPQYCCFRSCDVPFSVSVLFSEPKIPQSACSARARPRPRQFQCSSASRKFLNLDPRTCVHPYFRPR